MMGLLGGLIGGLGNIVSAPFKMLGGMGSGMGGGFFGGMSQGLGNSMGGGLGSGGGLLSKLFSAGSGIGPMGGGMSTGSSMPMPQSQQTSLGNFAPGGAGSVGRIPMAPQMGDRLFDATGHPRPVGPEQAGMAPKPVIESNKMARQNIATYTDGGLPRTQAIQTMINDQVAKSGTPVGADYYQRMAQIESHYNPVARSPTGAKGLFQFTGGTWQGYGQGNPLDPIANTDAAIKLTDANYSVLNKRLGRAPNYTELYMAHNIGAGGAMSLVRADPNTPVTAALIGSNPDNNPKFLRGKDGKSTITAGQALKNYYAAWPTQPAVAPQSSMSGLAATLGGNQ